MVGVWADPVTAQVMMTLRAGMSYSWDPASSASIVHDASGRRII
jgi:hypothetical protein